MKTKKPHMILELFAGSRSIGKVAEKMGMEVLSSDITPYKDIIYPIDILNFDINKLPKGFKPYIIWASPPCPTFSVASIGTHWTGGKKGYIPKTEAAKTGIKIVKKTLEIIKQLNPKYWFIENPRGVLRKLGLIDGKYRKTITYCQYGDDRMKPTDIWTNNTKWKPKKMCKNGDPCHVSAPRGSKSGTQGRKSAYERSKIPPKLCKAILKSCL